MGEFALYIVVILTSHAFVAFDVSTIVVMLCIPYKTSQTRLSSITKIGAIESAWFPMCGFGN